jgi:citrate lyase beta subunit
MKHNQHASNFQFTVDPLEFDKNADKAFLQYCLGATLYMPGTKRIIDKILNIELRELTSMVMCFEDAIREDDVATAESNVLEHLDTISRAVEAGKLPIGDVPLIFLRVRGTDQFRRFSDRLTPEQARTLTGFIFPKFYSRNADEYLTTLEQLNERVGSSLYAMPIFEGRTIAYQETRLEELLKIKAILEPHRDQILNLRVGGTDFSSYFGVRRGINSSIYDILVVESCLSDILNVFNRAEDGYVVSAPVWEYFLAYKKQDLTHLLEENINHSLLKRNTIINDAVDGLLREVVLDKANGFIGKTVIHPSHVRYVNAMQAVTKEEYDDAVQILETSGGVIKSSTKNKMNEINPHRSWAERIVSRARAYGVVEDETSYLKLIMA